MNRRGFLAALGSLISGATLIPSFLEGLYASAGRTVETTTFTSGRPYFQVAYPGDVEEGDLLFWDEALQVVTRAPTATTQPLGVAQEVEEYEDGRLRIRVRGKFILEPTEGLEGAP